jgi:predicted outer membrane protein
MQLTHTIRTASALCTAALISITTAGCMMGGMAMDPAAMQAHHGMHMFSMAVHMSEIEDAQMAMGKTQNAQVREFAQRMMTEHTAAMQAEERMMAAMGMGMGMGERMGTTATTDMARMREMLMAHPMSRPVMESHMQMTRMMQPLTGVAFDRAYMNGQVTMHRYALTEMDRMMAAMGMTADASMAGNMDMSAMASMTPSRESMMMMEQHNRAMVAMHLEMAQQRMAAMGNAR